LNSKLQLLGLKSEILNDQLELLDPQDPEDEALLQQNIRLLRSQVETLQHLVVTPGLSLSVPSSLSHHGLVLSSSASLR
jgi:hypothetical protein